MVSQDPDSSAFMYYSGEVKVETSMLDDDDYERDLSHFRFSSVLCR